MQSFIVSHAIYAIILFGVLEAMCIPISSELTSLLGGAIASGGVAGTTQHPSLVLVIVVGTLAEMVGSYISYYVGRVGGKPLVHRWGRYVLVTEGDVARAERFLVGRGAWALPVARMLPFVRAFNTALLQGCIHACCVGDKPAGGRRAFARCSRNQQNLARLIRIFYQRNRRERSTSLPAWRSWYIRRRFLGTWVFITDKFRLGLRVEHEPKVKLIAEQR